MSVIVSGTDAKFQNELIMKLLEQGKKVYALYDTVFETPDQAIPEGVQAIVWNPRSGVSTSAAVLSAAREMQVLDEVYIHIQCEDIVLPLDTVSWAAMRQIVDRHLLALLFLLREYSSVLLKQSQGKMILSLRHKEGSASPLLQMIEGAIVSLAEALFLQFSESPISFRAFRSDQDEKSFVAYLLRSLEELGEKSVKRWYRHSERLAFFKTAQ